ncbi:type VI secretion system contractile sheath large subunit [Pseudoduganella sp. LjRoot289]|uniref:type VI secretion system contractile sheath domain-containing protein n=1 Tax=Pseudoduganella sp. LjRoot289 TaxID=3342314 RepID=UPI003ECFF042
MATSLTFEFGFAAPDPQEHSADGQPMRILVLGGFSGGDTAAAPAATALGQRAARRVDIDNFEQVLAQVAPSVQVTLDDVVHTFRFSELDDFHPDRLYQKTDAFAALRGQRQRLRNPATFAAAAAALRPDEHVPAAAGAATLAPGGTDSAATRDAAPLPGSGNPGAGSPASASAPDNGTTGDDFASLLGGQVRQTAASSTVASAVPGIGQLIRQLVGAMPAGADPRQSEYVAAVDSVISQRMRALLHAPQFQALEALWRGLHQLVTGLELGQELQLYILDASKAELQADVDASVNTASGKLGSSALHKLLVERPRSSADAAPWSVLCGAYSFGPGADDIGLLSALGALAAQAQAPFIADAQDALLGIASLPAQPDASGWPEPDAEAAARWSALRASPQASWLGLALPRVLQRLPYGKTTDSIDQFDFDEAGAAHAHEDYLWGHASLACTLLLGHAFENSAWDMSPGDELDLGDLPAHIVRRDGEAHMQACAEAYLSERTGDAILQRGLMPLLSFKNRNAARLLRSQSISQPAQALSGAWNN